MKYNLYFFTYLFTTIFFCNGMENIPQEKILREITIVQNPIKTQYLETKDRAIIFGAQGCAIVNPLTNQEIIKINNDSYNQYTSYFALRPDKKKVALSDEKTLKIYNTETGQQEWSTTEDNNIGSVTFSPLENAIFLICTKYSPPVDGDNELHSSPAQSTIIKHNYITNQRTEIYKGDFLYPMSLHPTQNVLCAGNNKGKFFLYAVDDLKSNPKENELPKGVSQKYFYNHDGSFIVAPTFGRIYIIANNLTGITDIPDSKKMHSTILNANSTILVALSTIKQTKQTSRAFDLLPLFVIKYYDILTKKCIYSAKIEQEIDVISGPQDISFSPDETELMIVLNRKCIIVPVPFEVSKKQAIFRYWILKNYQQNNPWIPDDVIQYIALKL